MADETQGQEAKNKKINRLNAEQLNAKISDFDSKNQTKSIYYKHLLQRKRETERGK